MFFLFVWVVAVVADIEYLNVCLKFAFVTLSPYTSVVINRMFNVTDIILLLSIRFFIVLIIISVFLS